MDTKFLAAKGWQNPLGIIALFVLLIYGISALLLSNTISSLTVSNQTILILFAVLFPPTVLAAFCWLVAKHHEKLYGPRDYRQDASFLETAKRVPAATLGARLREEALEAAAEEGREPGGSPEDSASLSGSLPRRSTKRRHPRSHLGLALGRVADEYFLHRKEYLALTWLKT